MNDDKEHNANTKISLPNTFGALFSDSNGEMSAFLRYPQIGIPIGTPVYFQDSKRTYLVGEIESQEETDHGLWVTARISKSFPHSSYDLSEKDEGMLRELSNKVREDILRKIGEVILGKGYTDAVYYSPSFDHTETHITIRYHDESEEI